MWVPTRPLLAAMLSAVNGVGADTFAILDGAFSALIKAPYGPTVNSVLTDPSLSEANYQGYARQAISAWNGPYVGQNAKSLTADSALFWSPTGDDTVNTIYGHMLIGSDSTTLLAVEMFDDSIPQVDEDSGFMTTPIFGLDPNANYGSSLVGN